MIIIIEGKATMDVTRNNETFKKFIIIRIEFSVNLKRKFK